MSKNSVITGRTAVNGGTLTADIDKAFSNQDKLIRTLKERSYLSIICFDERNLYENCRSAIHFNAGKN